MRLIHRLSHLLGVTTWLMETWSDTAGLTWAVDRCVQCNRMNARLIAAAEPTTTRT